MTTNISHLTYNSQTAYCMMQLSYAVYFFTGKDKKPDKVRILDYLKQKDNGFQDLEGFSNKSTQSIVVAHKDFIALVFRGTDEIADWLDSLNAVSTKKLFGVFHKGFYNAVEDVWQPMEEITAKYQQIKKRSVWFCGHSLGGAMATIAAARYLTKLRDVAGIYTFGQPRCLGRKTAKKLNSKVKTYYRFQNNNDIVTKFPSAILGYKHAGDFIYITEEGELHKSASKLFMLFDGVKGTLNGFRKKKFDYIDDHGCRQYLQAIEKWGVKPILD